MSKTYSRSQRKHFKKQQRLHEEQIDIVDLMTAASSAHWTRKQKKLYKEIMGDK